MSSINSLFFLMYAVRVFWSFRHGESNKIKQISDYNTDRIRHFTDDVVEWYEHSVLLTLLGTLQMMSWSGMNTVLLTLLGTLQMMSWSGMNTLYY